MKLLLLLLHYEKTGEVIDVVGRYALAVNDSNAHLAAGLAGMGVIQTFTFMAGPYLESGELELVLKDWAQPQHPVYVVYPPNRHLSAKVRVFVDWVAELFRTLEP